MVNLHRFSSKGEREREREREIYILPLVVQIMCIAMIGSNCKIELIRQVKWRCVVSERICRFVGAAICGLVNQARR